MTTVSASLLMLAQIVFLWMFLSSEPLETMADGNLITGTAPDIRAEAYLFAARWRHGMTEGWRLYMPGFFAVAVTSWFWALQHTLRRMLIRSTGLLLVAFLAAWLAQPWGTTMVLEEFQAQTSLICATPAPSVSIVGILRSVYTLVTFGVGIISIQRAIAGRSWKPLLLPIALNVVLSQIRPWTVADFTSYWARQVWTGDMVATFSLLAAITAAIVMFLGQYLNASRFREDTLGAMRRNMIQQ